MSNCCLSQNVTLLRHKLGSKTRTTDKEQFHTRKPILYLAYFSHTKGFWTCSMKTIVALFSDMDRRNRLSASLNWSELGGRETRINSSLSGTFVHWEGRRPGANVTWDSGVSGSKGTGNSRGLGRKRWKKKKKKSHHCYKWWNAFSGTNC